MAGTRKYEGLPDLDIAPDVYETPELTDDVSTLQATSARSPSQNSDAEDGAEDESGIDRRHWRTGQARTRFRPARVDADNVDFSERLNATRRSYRTFTGRRRAGVRDDEPEEIGDLSDEEDETLDRKLARLRREVEQIKSTLEERKAEASRNGTATEPIDESEDPLADIGRISEALDAVYSERHGDARGAESGLSRTLSKFAQAEESMKSAEPTTRNLSQPSTSSAEPQLGQTLTKIADFDSRLTFLENAIGLNGLNMPDTGIDMPKLILPTLDTLERLIELATASPSNLDAAQSKTRQLVRDAERLHRLRSEDGDGAPPSGKSSGNNQAVPPISDSEQHTSKVNALYGVLPTIDSLSPTVPLMLDRLRSLRLIHTSAAGAKEVLDDVEKRQAEQAEEIEQWRNALELVEGNLKDGQTALVDNVHKVGELVSQLETRVSKVT